MRNSILSFLMAGTLISGVATACNDDKNAPEFPVKDTVDTRVRPEFARGADIGWVTEMEKSGLNFYDASGIKKECFSLMKSIGMNSIRLRVWVDPKDGWCNKSDMLAKAYRAESLGMDIMVDFHYSDSWADPGQQYKPASWAEYTVEEINGAIAAHTKDVLVSLKDMNITPKWVQVGNETNNGMIWDEGKASENMANYAAFTTSGYDAVKEIFPSAKVIVHLAEGNRKDLYKWIFDGLKNNGGKWDVIGMSLYPENGVYQPETDEMLENINDLISRYNTEIMICEVGMDNDKPEICKEWINYIMDKTIDNEKCLGIFYWEPQCYNDWKGYTKGAFDESGRPTSALDPFKR